MELNVELIRIDLLSGTTTIIADGRAILVGSTLSYAEKDDIHCLHRVTFGKDCITLKRSGEYGSETVLMPHKKGKAVVHSPYGDMVMDTILDDFLQNDGLWMAEYRILSEGGIVTRQRLMWKLKGLQNAC